MRKKISVIIPVYNGERYIQDCLDSILNQSYKEIEVIIINDGSTDSTEEICEANSKCDSRIKLYTINNSGVSMARNLGLEIATGELISFIDADDTIEKEMFIKLLKGMEELKSDCAICGFNVLGDTNRKNDTYALKNISKSNQCLSSKKIIENIILTSNESIKGYIWRMIFDKSIIDNKNIKFENHIKISEDFMFILNYLRYSDYVYILDEELYNYRLNENSVTNKYIDTLHENMSYINRWMYDNICSKDERLLKGYNCCCLLTYLRNIQNLCRYNSPYSIVNAWKLNKNVKKEFEYDIQLKKIKDYSGEFDKKTWISLKIMSYNLEFLYMCLFKIKEMKNYAK